MGPLLVIFAIVAPSYAFYLLGRRHGDRIARGYIQQIIRQRASASTRQEFDMILREIGELL